MEVHYKVLEGNRPPNRRKMLIVAPDINDVYHAFVQDMVNIFDVKHLEYDIDAPEWCKPCADNVLDLSEMIVTGTRPCVTEGNDDYDEMSVRKIFLSHGIRVESNHTTFM